MFLHTESFQKPTDFTDDLQALEKDITLHEIINAVKWLKTDKVLGPHGFSAELFFTFPRC